MESKNFTAERPRNREAENFGALYDQYVKKIYNFIYYKTFHKETAEDLTAQTFLKAWEHLDSWRADNGKFSSWLYTIARNTVIDYYRTRKNQTNIDDIWDIADNSELIADMDNQDALNKVKKYLGTIPSEQREIIILRVWEGMSYAEIGEILGKSENACKTGFCRALKQLKTRMPLTLLLLFLTSLKI